MIQAIGELKEAITMAENELNDCLLLCPADKEAVKRARDELKDAISDRIDFWRDTFRSEPEGLYEADAYSLYADYGCKFTAPTKTEISQVLDTLDKKYPGWDSQKVEPFYATLETSCPQRVKKEKKRKSAKKGTGCLSSCLFCFSVL